MMSEMVSGVFRPNLSLIGPTISWPIARPAIEVVRVSWVVETLVPNHSVIAGSAGR